MNDLNTHLRELLESATGRNPSGGVPAVEALRRLDAMAADRATALDPRLRHFLERRSYVKALDWLAGEGGS